MGEGGRYITPLSYQLYLVFLLLLLHYAEGFCLRTIWFEDILLDFAISSDVVYDMLAIIASFVATVNVEFNFC